MTRVKTGFSICTNICFFFCTKPFTMYCLQSYLFNSCMPLVKVILSGNVTASLKSTDTISSVALWRIISTCCSWGGRGSSNVSGRNIKPLWVGCKGNAPLCKRRRCSHKLESIMRLTYTQIFETPTNEAKNNSLKKKEGIYLGKIHFPRRLHDITNRNNIVSDCLLATDNIRMRKSAKQDHTHWSIN